MKRDLLGSYQGDVVFRSNAKNTDKVIFSPTKNSRVFESFGNISVSADDEDHEQQHGQGFNLMSPENKGKGNGAHEKEISLDRSTDEKYQNLNRHISTEESTKQERMFNDRPNLVPLNTAAAVALGEQHNVDTFRHGLVIHPPGDNAFNIIQRPEDSATLQKHNGERIAKAIKTAKFTKFDGSKL